MSNCFLFDKHSFYYPGAVGNELGTSDPEFMRLHGDEFKQDSGKWIDSCVWHGKAHTWEKVRWVIGEVRSVLFSLIVYSTFFVISGNASPADVRSSSKASNAPLTL